MEPIRRRRSGRLLILLIVLVGCAGILAKASAKQGIPVATRPAAGNALLRPHAARFVYVAIGASDSYGTGLNDPTTEAWPAVFARSLPARTQFVNLGVPGILLQRATVTELPVAIDAHPSVVTVWLAVNDLAAGVALDRYRHELDVLLGSLKRSTRARVLIANIPDLALIPAFAGRPALAAMVQSWNQQIDDAAHANGATLVDLYSHWHELARHPEYVGADGLHPSAEGSRRLAALFLQAYRAPATQ